MMKKGSSLILAFLILLSLIPLNVSASNTETPTAHADHTLIQYAQKMPACTEAGWMAYEACSECDYTTFVEIPAAGHSFDRNIRSIAHRGYSQTAPENTLPAYRLAKKNGFTYVECDVSLTSDGVPVLLHDDTIDRTSNGTGEISRLTYAQLLGYDFGSWKSADYAGTKIATFEEFISLCAELNLSPYVELKTSGGYTQESIQHLVEIVEKYDLAEKTSWLSFDSTYLEYVRNAAPRARLGFVKRSDATQSVINTAKSLQNGSNEVFLDLNYTQLTNTGVLRAAANGLPLEVYTVDTESAVLALPSYVSGVTSNVLNANTVLRNAEASDHHCVVCGQNMGPTITTQPSTRTVKAGTTATFRVTADGVGLTYQWQYKTSSSGSWKNCRSSGNQTAALKASGTTGNHGNYIRCRITNKFGNVVYSKTVRLYVLGIKTQPVTQKVETDERAVFTVSATGRNKTYQWQYKTSSSGTWKNTGCAGNKTSTLKVAGTTGRNGYYFRCRITDSAGNVIYTDIVRLYVLGIKTQPASQSVQVGERSKFTVKATGHGLTYQWQYKTSSSGTWKNTGSAGNKTDTLKVLGTTARNGYYFRCRITDSAGNVTYTKTVRLTVK